MPNGDVTHYTIDAMVMVARDTAFLTVGWLGFVSCGWGIYIYNGAMQVSCQELVLFFSN